MEHIDPEAEARVWQRVLGQPQQAGEDFRPLMLAAAEAAAVYQQLSRDTAGKSRETLRELYQGELSNVACLRGIQALNSGSAGKPVRMQASREPRDRALEKCYHRARRALAEYAARSADPEFGPVFARMAEREKVHLALLAELLGETK